MIRRRSSRAILIGGFVILSILVYSLQRYESHHVVMVGGKPKNWNEKFSYIISKYRNDLMAVSWSVSSDENMVAEYDGHFADHRCKFRGIVIHAGYRTGSTFTSEILRRQEQIFFMFEPLHLLEISQWSDYKRTHQILEDALTCNLQKLPQHFWLKAMLCEQGSWIESCPEINLTLASDVCKSRIPAVKVIRLEKLSYLEDLMWDGVFVIVVIRDPRSVMYSWSDWQFPLSPNKKSLQRNETQEEAVHRYCDAKHEDFLYMRSLLNSRLSASFYLLRYEDMVHAPEYHIYRIHEAMGLIPEESVSGFVEEIFEQKSGLWYVNETLIGTSRNDPDHVPDRWRGSLKAQNVQLIQEICAPMMTDFGYIPVDEESVLSNISIPLVNYNWRFTKY